MRILALGAVSIHAVRTLEVLTARGWDVHLFPTSHTAIHDGLRNLTLYADPFVLEHLGAAHASVSVVPLRPSAGPGPLQDSERSRQLAQLIPALEPDLIHALETQTSGYVAIRARRLLDGRFPPLILGLFGADLYYYTRLPRHRARLAAVLSAADYVLADNHRDLALSRRLGFDGRFLPVMAVGGGFDGESLAGAATARPPSRRRSIAARLQADWIYRPRTVLAGLERCADLLAGYRLEAYYLSPSLRRETERVCAAAGMSLNVVSDPINYAAHDKMMAMHGRARASIGAAIGDGTSLSTIEAGLMGSFPVHSYQSAVGEWFRDGQTAMLFDGDDPADLARVLRPVLSDDRLVDDAAAENAALRQRVDRDRDSARLLDAYERVRADQARR